MISMLLAATLLTSPIARPSPAPIPQDIVQIPPTDDDLNIMFVASKGNRKYRILTLPAFQKELNRCIMLHTEFFDTPDGPLIVFRCEERE